MKLSRRFFLGGAATLVGLPWLESLAPRSARAETLKAPQRFVAFYTPNGIVSPHWRPDAVGTGFALPEVLSSLAPVKAQVTIVSGLQNNVADGEDGPHARGTGSFLTGVRILASESELVNGISIDQQLVRAVAPTTRFPSLQLGIDGGSNAGGCDADFSCAYQRNISWAGPSSPMTKLVSPALVFERLFGGTDAGASAAETARRRALKQSVLDHVLGEAHALQPRLAGDDRRKLDEYLTGIRELELRVLGDGPPGSCAVAAPGRDFGKMDVVAHVRVMLDLIVAAFQCDQSRFVTFMLANSGSSRTFEFLGLDDDHHDLSHHAEDPDKIAKLRVVDAWQVAQFAYLARRLAAIEEGEGTLLDHSLLFLSSELGDGSRHDHEELPVVLAGSAGGALATGQHLRAEKEPIANLYLRFLEAFGAPADRFGSEGTRVLGGL